MVTAVKTIYIDVLITVNLFVDFLLLLGTRQLLSIRAKQWRLILGAVFGGLCSLCVLLPRLPFGLNLLLDLGIAAAVVLCAFGFGGLKNFIRRVAVLFALSFCFCGLMTLLYTTFQPEGMEIINNTVYFNISPVLLIILTLVCYYTMRLVRRLTKGACGKSTCQTEIYLNGESAVFIAAIDTGCNVKEPFSGESVIIAEDAILHDLRLENATMRIIPFESLGGSGLLRGYRLDRLIIDGKESGQSAYLGVCDGVLKGEIKALMPYELTKEQ